MKKILILLIIGSLGSISEVFAQQDPQYTQYMYNTEIINPAYAGSREALSFAGLYRSQWVGLDGAPDTFTFSVHSPIKIKNVGLGLSLVHDEIGPSQETYANIDYSYTIWTSAYGRLAFGLKTGFNVVNIDYSKLNVAQEGDIFDNNINNRIRLQIGTGIYYYTDKFYVGLSAPNLIESKYFDEESLGNPDAYVFSREKIHLYLMSGYVFDLSPDVKFKPATLMKAVAGAPLQVDVSANFLIYDKLSLGAAWRWSAALSALVGFQLSDELMLGFAYDQETTELAKYNNGSFEFYLRYEIFKSRERIYTPRFF
ncbi:hypothetical protein C7S20_12320 [Christiangramia fulva]|uniref:Type IX secretion system membrane protein PorP/SprF n=1 Tax=Christiangramia fulva TaxID=2126553 RepID=A0A2R3Z6X0_9FLAO|nr:type IX secretion system membrane protein PorP/SprF [Christiangramia fulva]AVR45974.1 hypothetical protein C7S20_12320 [Christiangramia fulva]